MSQKFFKVNIFTPSKILIINGKPIRTPVQCILNKVNLDDILLQLRINGISKYSVTPIRQTEESTEKDIFIEKEVIFEELKIIEQEENLPDKESLQVDVEELEKPYSILESLTMESEKGLD